MGASKLRRKSGILGPLRPERRPVFLHFLDAPYYRSKARGQFAARAAREAAFAVRLAIILSSDILVPAAAYYENPTAKKLLDQFRDTDVADLFELVGTGDSIEAFSDAKLPQYPADTIEGRIYRRRLFQPFPWVRRSRSATEDISTAWMETLTSGALEEKVLVDRKPSRIAKISKQWTEVSERLSGKAFTASNAAQLLPDILANEAEKRNLQAFINNEYLLSYLVDIRAGVFQRMPWLGPGKSSVSVLPKWDIDFRALTTALQDEKVASEIASADPRRVRMFINDKRFVDAFQHSQGVEVTASKRTVGAIAQVPEKVDALIVTALPVEKDAVLAVYGRHEKRTYPRDNHIYYMVTERVGNRWLKIAVAHPDQMGEAPASATATDMLRTFETNFVVVTGVAGGCPNPSNPHEHVRLGDIVVANQIFKHDHIKLLSSGKKEFRDRPQHVGAKWIQTLSSCHRDLNKWDPAWERYLASASTTLQFSRPPDTTDILRDYSGVPVHHPDDEERVTGKSRVFEGLIASGATLLKDPILRDELRDLWGARAVEMESSGVRDAVRTKQKELISIRGVMDYCDGGKNDHWKLYAALAAASFTRMLVSRIPLDWL
jgi:nucleoside phosphorylase